VRSGLSIRRSDYENYDYQQFWEGNKRLYEDYSERIALRRLLKGEETRGRLFLDIGCGYGRLFNEYRSFSRIALVDYSMNNLANARIRINKFLSDTAGDIPRVLYVAADAARLPFKAEIADVILTVRMVHHLEYPEKYFDQVRRILKEEGPYILEFANKRNTKSILKFFIGKMDISPFNKIPSQVGETIKNYHPAYIYDQLVSRGIIIEKSISVSNFRLGFLKKIPGISVLALLENLYQKFFPFITLGPSIFIKSRKKSPDCQQKKPIRAKHHTRFKNNDSTGRLSGFMDIIICPGCGSGDFKLEQDKVECLSCGRSFNIKKGIIDFRI
jgi:ubiquinone/menaquinone biosynthesis C-methylase UbiE/ribosomal protein S27E